ncbi:MAG: VWA domain-containing protein [Streptosporangiales bacterium]|nr:VWA domain-containing protein [Streptosporangiales bacterium]
MHLAVMQVLAADWKFKWPAVLWLGILGVVALVVLYILLQRRRNRFAVRFTNVKLLDKVAPRRPSWRKHLPALAFVLTLLVVIVAAARPAYAVQVPRERATVVLAMDISPSMLSGDVKPNRLAAAKKAAKSFLDEVPPKINVGLVAFSRSGNVKVPPTTERAAMQTGIDDLKVDKYTAIGEGVFASLDAVKLAPKPRGTDKKVPAAVILMSDGESTVGRSNQEAAAAAKEQKVPVSTIAFGTDDGTVTIAPNPFPQTVPPDPEALREIAETTGGKFYEATDGQQLNRVYEDLGSSIGYVKSYRETTYQWALAGLLSLVVTAALGLALTSKFP